MKENHDIHQSEEDENLKIESSIPKFSENLFGFEYYKLTNPIQLGGLILQHRRCKPDCYTLVELHTICLSQIKLTKLTELNEIHLTEAKEINNQILKHRINKNTKQIQKKKPFLNKLWVIKKNAYLIRKLTEIGMTKDYISMLLRISKSSIYYREKQIPEGQQLQIQFYFNQEHLDWLKQDIKKISN